MSEQETAPVPLFGGGDQRSVTLLDALVEVINERGCGLPFPMVLGTIKLLEMTVIDNQRSIL